MSDTGNPTTESQDSAQIQQLRDRAAQATRLEKENAFLRAGIKLDDKMAMRMFKQYEGEFTVEAIKAEAEDWGLNEQPEAPAGDPAQGQDAQMGQFSSAQNGEPPPAAAPPEPPKSFRAEAWKEWNERDRGQPEETHQLAMIDRYIVAAAEGNTEAIFDEEKWLTERAQAGYDFRPKGGVRS